MTFGDVERGLGWWRAFVFLLPMVVLAPFSTKPYQADDHLSIWVAEQIARHPFDFFGFEVDYGYTRVPIHMVSHNPPGTAYFMALIGALTDWNIVALHLGMSLFAGLAAWGTFELARDLGARPVAASAAAALTPAFLVSASTLMTDVPMVAFYVWAVVAWRRGFARNSWRWMLCAAVCAALAPMMKFFGVTLLPLLLADGLFRRPRPRGWWMWLGVPVAAFGALQAYTYFRYGTTPFFDAAGVATSAKWRTEETSATRPVLTFVFLGGGFLPIALIALGRVGVRVTLGVFASVAFLGAPVLDGYSLLQLLIGQPEPYSVPVLLHLAAFMFAGVVIPIACVRALRTPGRSDAFLLAAWIGGTLLFTAYVNHYVNARTILPLLPAAVAVLAIPAVNTRLFAAACALGLALSVWLLVADYDVAAHDARAARAALARADEEGKPLYYVAYWGFEYDLMKGGAEPLGFAEKKDFAEPTRPLMNPGDLLIVDAYASGAWRPPPAGFTVVEEIDETYTAGATTFDAGAKAGFYSHRIGALPFRVGYTRPEKFLLLRWNGQD